VLVIGFTLSFPIIVVTSLFSGEIEQEYNGSKD